MSESRAPPKSSNPRPDEEGIKTLGLGRFGFGSFVQTHALMKKGLRQHRRLTYRAMFFGSDPRPDEEGIKTLRAAAPRVQTHALMKKGLRRRPDVGQRTKPTP